MKAILAGYLLTTLLVITGFAQSSEVIIKQRAKELSNQNNVRQGVAPPTQPQTPPPSATATAAAQPQNPALARLRADLAAIQAGSTPTPEQKQKLTTDIIAVAQSTKPSA